MDAARAAGAAKATAAADRQQDSTALACLAERKDIALAPSVFNGGFRRLDSSGFRRGHSAARRINPRRRRASRPTAAAPSRPADAGSGTAANWKFGPVYRAAGPVSRNPPGPDVAEVAGGAGAVLVPPEAASLPLNMMLCPFD